jgi:hypothetical protein
MQFSRALQRGMDWALFEPMIHLAHKNKGAPGLMDRFRFQLSEGL